MIEQAEKRGDLRPGMTILEATSGNTGVSLAMMARIKGYPIQVVMPDNVSRERTLVMRAFGAEVILTDGAKYTDGAIELASQLAAEDSSYFLTSQFSNADNPLAHYETTGPEILRDLAGRRRLRCRHGDRRDGQRRRTLPEGATSRGPRLSAWSRRRTS